MRPVGYQSRRYMVWFKNQINRYFLRKYDFEFHLLLFADGIYASAGAIRYESFCREDAEYCIRKVLNVKLWEDPTDSERAWSSSVKDNGYGQLPGHLHVYSHISLRHVPTLLRFPSFHELVS